MSTTGEGARGVGVSATSDAMETGAAAAVTPPHASVTIIESERNSWSWLDLRDFWAHRELLYFLIWRDVKVRYKQAALGLAWVVIQPLLTTLLFTVILGMLARVPSNGAPYPLFVFTGLLGWSFFASSIAVSGNSLVGNAELITKVFFPRLLLPAAAVGARLLDFAISLLVLCVMMAYYRVGVTPKIAMLPLLAAMLALLALGCGTLLSALNVKYRDVNLMLPALLQLWMFASPIIYPASMIPAAWRWVYSLNPLVGIVEGLRSSVLGQPFDWPSLAVSGGAAVLVPLSASYLFRRAEAGFADNI